MTRTPSGRDRERDHLLTRLAQGACRSGFGRAGRGRGWHRQEHARRGHCSTRRTPAVSTCCTARSWELSASVPYESLVAAVSRYLRSRPIDDVRRLTNGLPTLGALIEWLDLQPPATAPEAFKVRAQDAFATLIARIGAEQPVVFALDDLHWADQASLEVLQYLCLDLPDSPLLLVFTVRPDEADRRPEVRQFLATLRRSPWTSTIRLGRLDRPAIDAVVTDRLGGNVTPRVYETIATTVGRHAAADPRTARRPRRERCDRATPRDLGVARRRRAADEIGGRSHPVAPRPRRSRTIVPCSRRSPSSTGRPTPRSWRRCSVSPVDAVEGSLERLRAIRLAIETDRDQTPRVRGELDGRAPDRRRGGRGRTRRRRAPSAASTSAGGGCARPRSAGAPDTPSSPEIRPTGSPRSRCSSTRARKPSRGRRRPRRSSHSAARSRCCTRATTRLCATAIERDLGIAYLRQLEVGPALVHLRRAWDQARARRRRSQPASSCCCHSTTPSSEPATAGSAVSDLESVRAAIAARSRQWDLLVELGWVHVSHAGRGQSLAELENARAALAMIPSSSTARPPRSAARAARGLQRRRNTSRFGR